MTVIYMLRQKYHVMKKIRRRREIKKKQGGKKEKMEAMNKLKRCGPR